MRAGHQDSYELYKIIDIVKHGKLYHPVYAKIKKRGYHTRGNDVYEYGWDFNYAENERKGSDTFDYESAIKRVTEYLNNGSLEGFSDADVRAINKIYSRQEKEEQVAPKQNEDGIEYDWQYMEDSGYSGTLEDKNVEDIISDEDNMFFLKDNALEYLQNLKEDGIDISTFEVKHIKSESEDEDDYYVISKKSLFSDEDVNYEFMNHCKH